MPELPEVETIKNYLRDKLIDKVITDVQTIHSKQLDGDPKKIINQKIIAFYRKGKVLAFQLDNNYYVNIHLKMSGQLIHSAKNKINSNTRIIFDFDDKTALYFNDQRRFGWIKITTQLLFSQAIDILSDNFTLPKFKEYLQKTKKAIKPLLLEQNTFTGLGNIYVNDALFMAKILPTRSSCSLMDKEVSDLFQAVKQVISEGLKYKGYSGKDKLYVLPDGSHGSYQNHFKVYERDGQKCLHCNEKIIKIRQNSRSSFYCPNCQK